MARHVGKVLSEPGYQGMPVYQGTCRCTAHGPFTSSHAEADAWIDKHLLDATRAQVHRTTRNPTLEDQAKWYRQMANTAADPVSRQQWAQLADELEHRLGGDEHSTQQDLW